MAVRAGMAVLAAAAAAACCFHAVRSASHPPGWHGPAHHGAARRDVTDALLLANHAAAASDAAGIDPAARVVVAVPPMDRLAPLVRCGLDGCCQSRPCCKLQRPRDVTRPSRRSCSRQSSSGAAGGCVTVHAGGGMIAPGGGRRAWLWMLLLRRGGRDATIQAKAQAVVVERAVGDGTGNRAAHWRAGRSVPESQPLEGARCSRR
jgi:hypothetical protein